MSVIAGERFEKIQVAPAYQLVAEAVEREIVLGRLRPGEPIGTEALLARQFGVNRSTVREGIRALEEGGFVQRGGDRKLYVCLPRYNRLSSRLSRALILQEVTFRELFVTALTLEIASVEGAAMAITPELLAALEDNQAQAEAVAHDAARLSEIDTEFHALVAKASANRVLQLAREPAALLFFPTTELICRRLPEGAPRLLAAHRHIIDALRLADTAAASLWMRRHVDDWRKGFERAGRDLDESVERVYARNLPLGGAL